MEVTQDMRRSFKCHIILPVKTAMLVLSKLHISSMHEEIFKCHIILSVKAAILVLSKLQISSINKLADELSMKEHLLF
jgi:hypothetical protein